MASDSDRAKALLTYANYAKVATALQVSRTAVAEWAKGQSVTPYRLRQLEQLLRPDLQTQKEPPPEWAGALPGEVAAAVIERLAEIPEIAQAAAVELGLAGPRPAESGTEADEAPRGTGYTTPPPPKKRASR